MAYPDLAAILCDRNPLSESTRLLLVSCYPYLRVSAVLATAALLLTSCGGGVQAAPLAKTPKGLKKEKLVIPADNPMTAEKAELGKMLFFDKRLSSNGEVSCQTCHMHEKGWTDGQRFSKKVGGAMNTRNSPTLYNVGYQKEYYWDGRAPSMEANVMAAWKGHMGGDPDGMAKTLAGIEGYKPWFQAAFQSEPTGDNIVKALTTFVRTLRSGDSAFDKRKLSADAKAGELLFTVRCSMCHQLPKFTDLIYHNVGAGEKPDPGRAGKKDQDNPMMKGAFKTPTLRSVTKTAPYFHDGSKATLREAVAFMYQGGLKNSDSWDPLLMGAKAQYDQETPEQREKNIDLIVEFLKTLESTETFTPPKLP